jgi:iron complex transport system ATP-binding protein
VVVTHELNLASEFADQIVLMHKGKCLAVGTPRDVYQRELLERVFDAQLDVEAGPGGRPRVIIHGNPEMDLPGPGRSSGS